MYLIIFCIFHIHYEAIKLNQKFVYKSQNYLQPTRAYEISILINKVLNLCKNKLFTSAQHKDEISFQIVRQLNVYFEIMRMWQIIK